MFLASRDKRTQGRLFWFLTLPLLTTFFFSPSNPCASQQSRKIDQKAVTIPLVDLAGQKDQQVIVDKEPGQYLGHPTTVLLEDHKTILCVYPKGHGKGAICLKKKHRWWVIMERPAPGPGKLGDKLGNADDLSGHR